MAVNIKTGNNSKVALVTAALNTLFDAANLAIIIETDGASNKSYVPGRVFNPLTNITAGKGYFIIAKQDLDRETQFNGSAPLQAEAPSNGMYMGGVIVAS